jgi:hypothetical protein
MPRRKKQEAETSPTVVVPEPEPKTNPTETPKKKRGRKPKERVKKPKQPSAYAQFVKANYDKSRHLPPKERFKFISKMWTEHKEKKE